MQAFSLRTRQTLGSRLMLLLAWRLLGGEVSSVLLVVEPSMIPPFLLNSRPNKDDIILLHVGDYRTPLMWTWNCGARDGPAPNREPYTRTLNPTLYIYIIYVCIYGYGGLSSRTAGSGKTFATTGAAWVYSSFFKGFGCRIGLLDVSIQTRPPQDHPNTSHSNKSQPAE